MSVKGKERSLAKVNAEIIDEDRFVFQCMVCHWIWSPGFPSTYGRKAICRWIYPDRFNALKPNTDSDPGQQIGIYSKRRRYGKKYTK